MASEKVVKEAESTQDVVYMPLNVFADTYATKYGVELMGGFFHVQEKELKFADTEENWCSAIEAFAKKEVK